MTIFIKVTSCVLITAILCLVVSRHSADLSLLLTICVCCMVIISAFSYLTPVFDFARRLIDVGKLNHELLNVLLKVVGIGLVSQIAGLICADSGNQSLGKALQIMTTAVILCICVPILEEMLTLIETVLGEI